MLHRRLVLYAFLKFLLFLVPFSRGLDTITLDTRISGDGEETLVSPGRVFELGFFSPGTSGSRRYVGIWYHNVSPPTVVWVVNRESPLNDTSGLFGFGVNGNLELSSGQSVIWSTKLKAATKTASSNRTAKLTDRGNLVLSMLSDNGTEETLWQSFEHPTDTFLPGMVMGGEEFKLTSWTGPGDPSPGNFTFQRDLDRGDQYIIQTMKPSLYWKSGVSWKLVPDGVPDAISSLLRNHSSNIDQSQNFTSIARLMISFDGKIKYFTWDGESKKWLLKWSEPRDRCHEFNACGNFAICNSRHEHMCRCLLGFEPQDNGDFSQGCTRTSHLCGKDTNSTTFQRLKLIKIGGPTANVETTDLEECNDKCLHDCKCRAYSYAVNHSTSTSRCWIWLEEDLNNIQEDTVEGLEVYVRTSSSKKGRHQYIFYLIAISVLVIAVGASLFVWRKSVNKQAAGGATPENPSFHLYDRELQIKEWMNSGQIVDDSNKEGIDVPFVNMEVILEATNCLSDKNKLGEGGFGPVYKGKFPGGQEIAVKRLSSGSGQGMEEFKNEVLLIGQLQHRNLVKLLGYCAEGDEKLLLYEYMPNKSLDSFIFDRTRSVLLNWETRMEIISGIARGMLYLHQDSRLRIVHRDLKASNVLLDEEMKPKISDFGLARIFQGKQTEASTNRVIGTFGYMSPEYALDGFFSFKSDVFSFGVLVLEIISGKRNTGFYQSKVALNLLSYAWRLWNEDNAINLIDQMLHETCNRDEALKCMKLALLCVQSDPSERPTMSNIVFTLSHDNVSLPTPKQPAFVVERGFSSEASLSSRPETYCEITNSLEQGR